MTRMKAVVFVGLTITALAITVWWQHEANSRLRQGLAEAEAQVAAVQAELERLRNENARLKESRAVAVPDLSSKQLSEMLRLRGEVGAARKQISEKDQQVKAAQASLGESMARAAKWGETGAVLTAMEAAALRNLSASAKTKMLRDAMATLRNVAETNQTGLLLHLAQVAPEAQALLQSLAPESGFDIVYQGPLNALQNPGQTIVVRQREPEEWPDGTFSRIYAFGDGHVEIHKTTDGQFEGWEAERLVPLAAGRR